MISLVAALSDNGVIGRDGKLPWHLPADLYRFRRLTRDQVVLMGRKTFESIGEPLEGRTNIVLTHDPSFAHPGVEVIHGIAPILHDPRPIYVIGGADVYRQMLPHADELRLTRVHTTLEGDTLFPPFDLADWELVSAKERPKDERNAYDLTIEVYRRIQQ